MKIFENHHDGFTTVVHGDYCSTGSTGYRLFHKDHAEKVFEQFGFSEQHRNDVLNAFGDVTIPDDIMGYHEDVRAEMARHGCFEILQVLVKDPHWYVRYNVAKHDNIILLRELVTDRYPQVRFEVAKHHEVELLRVLVNDLDDKVRYQVAKHEVFELLMVLMTDPMQYIVDYSTKAFHEMDIK